ncbi:hypothetical protein TNCV_3866771 [Trichonephila clavipes]|nr:hypothetical protein TNCV_3866771 [Trichonephila clavipes]
MTDVSHGDEVLEPYVRLFMSAVGLNFILKDNNARWLTDYSEDIHQMDSQTIVQGRSYLRINDTEPPSCRSPNKRDYSPPTGLPYPKRVPEGILIQPSPSQLATAIFHMSNGHYCLS